MLDSSLINQIKQYLQLLEKEVVITVSLDSSENSTKLKNFVEQVVQLSDKLSIKEASLKYTPSFELSSNGVSGIAFAGIPLGHELESFILALLQVAGRAPKIDADQVKRIQSIDKKLYFETVVSLTCHNCPEVVQSLNIISVLNANVSHTMIEGSMFQEYVESLDVMAVPACFLNGESFHNGRTTLNAILDKITDSTPNMGLEDKPVYDVLVIGGGPAGATAAIYAARKGIRTALIAEDFGGQVKNTLGIENITGTQYAEGPKYMEQVKAHVLKYNVDILDELKVENIDSASPLNIITNKGILKSKTVIIATGAKWRLLGIPGETEFKNKGVAYCTHCDGPLFKGKSVAVIGGGNSGIEAAIDLAGIAKNVLVLEFLPELKADAVLQEKLRSFKNVRVVTNASTTALTGETKLNGIDYQDRVSGEKYHEDIEGCFIQVGLVPTTEWINIVQKNNRGEIIVDNTGATNVPGIYAAGDCTDIVFKQIVIAQGSGATAALGAYNYLMRN